MENVKDWLKIESGRGFGSGNGSGYGFGYGSGNGSGYGSGYGYGYGCGAGLGSGYGFGYGFGRGSGNGSGYGLNKINGMEINLIDSVPTVIAHIKNDFATGFVLKRDFTLVPCYVAKRNGYFAHGETLKKAFTALQEKIFENMDTEKTIEEFTKKFKKEEKYPGTDFFEWHHYLTGSCLMGRETFVKNHGLNLNDLYTVNEFITICENNYGGEIIQRLKEFYE